jgi:hypothetical protein
MKLIVLSLFSIGIIESACAQDLQARVLQLEGRMSNIEYRLSKLETAPRSGTDNPWTCTLTLSVFNRTFVGTGRTKAIALAIVVKKCLDEQGSNIWCKPASAVCSNE